MKKNSVGSVLNQNRDEIRHVVMFIILHNIITSIFTSTTKFTPYILKQWIALKARSTPNILCYSPPSNYRFGFVPENNIIVAGLMSENHLFVLYYLTVLVFIKTAIHLSVVC